MTPDMKMGKYTYYRCTEWKGRCKNSISEPKLADRIADVVRDIRITPDVAEGLRVALHESHKDKVEFHRQAQDALERRYKAIVSRMDRAYDGKLDGTITEEFWRSKNSEWNAELCEIEMKIRSHREANLHYLELGNQIIELARSASDLFLRQTNEECRKLLKFLVSKMTYADGTLCPTYNKPFDILAKGVEKQSMRGTRYWHRTSPQIALPYSYSVFSLKWCKNRELESVGIHISAPTTPDYEERAILS